MVLRRGSKYSVILPRTIYDSNASIKSGNNTTSTCSSNSGNRSRSPCSSLTRSRSSSSNPSSSSPQYLLPITKQCVTELQNRKQQRVWRNIFVSCLVAMVIMAIMLVVCVRAVGFPNYQMDFMHKQERDALEEELFLKDVKYRREIKSLEKSMRRHFELQMKNQAKQFEVQLQQHLHSSDNDRQEYVAQIQKFSKRQVLHKFGNKENFYVELKLKLPLQERSKFIVLEMASLDLVPHAVYLFLNQVSEGLLNGLSFHINAPHVLLTTLVDQDGVDRHDQYHDKMLDTMAFAEYSPKFPHLKYTVGYGGSSGPEFYINKNDNTRIHGHTAGVDGDDVAVDPCFAKVVKGFDVVDKMSSLLVEQREDHPFLQQPVVIEEAYILPEFTSPATTKPKRSSVVYTKRKQIKKTLDDRSR